jgi:polysaccharide export outer membrane protein
MKFPPNNIFKNFLSLLIIVSLSSCISTNRLIYLQPSSEKESPLKVFDYKKQEYKLQQNDILDVQIRSTNDDANKLFMVNNQNNQGGAQAGASRGGDVYYMTGYNINDTGAIELPFIGNVTVEGKTLKEAKIKIEERLNKYLKTYFLSVKLGGIRFSAIGEFNRPGKNVILQNQATIFEAIALCGDLTSLAKRDEIKLIRQYPEGSKIHSINLLEDSIINSPYYFIHPNDVIYAVPLPQKSSGLGVTGSNTFTTLVTALTGSLALILTIITLNNR